MSSWRSVRGLGCSSVVECLLIACKAKGLILRTPSPPCKGNIFVPEETGMGWWKGDRDSSTTDGKGLQGPSPILVLWKF
jgi:hypothetical protein